MCLILLLYNLYWPSVCCVFNLCKNYDANLMFFQYFGQKNPNVARNQPNMLNIVISGNTEKYLSSIYTSIKWSWFFEPISALFCAIKAKVILIRSDSWEDWFSINCAQISNPYIYVNLTSSSCCASEKVNCVDILLP